MHYIRLTSLLTSWEIMRHSISLQVFLKPLVIDNFMSGIHHWLFAICSETLTHNWFLTSCPQPAAMPFQSLLSGCCSFHPAVGFLVLSPCGCKERIKIWVKLSLTAFPLQDLFFFLSSIASNLLYFNWFHSFSLPDRRTHISKIQSLQYSRLSPKCPLLMNARLETALPW